MLNSALEDCLVGYYDLRAAGAQNAADLRNREHRVERNCDAACANNSQEPMQASHIVGAINGDKLSWAQLDRPAQKSIDGANVGVQIGQ